MAELLEIVLEGVLRSRVYQVLMILLDKAGRIIDVQCSEHLPFFYDGKLSEKEVEIFLKLSDDASLLIKLSDLKINNVVIPSVLLRVVKYNDQFDIDFNFDEQDIESMSTTTLMKEIHSFVSKICESYEIDHWFGGMEPASDEATRFFTDKEIGPLADRM
jgi:hypothetical protein